MKFGFRDNINPVRISINDKNLKSEIEIRQAVGSATTPETINDKNLKSEIEIKRILEPECDLLTRRSTIRISRVRLKFLI